MVKVVRACRGDGVAYIEVAGATARDLVLVSTAEGRMLPASVVSLGKKTCAIVFPLVLSSFYVVESGDRSWSFKMGATELKLRSKLAYALRRTEALRLRDCDLEEFARCLNVRFIQVVEDGSEAVVRARVDVPDSVSKDARICINVLDVVGAETDLRPIVMEDCKDAVDERNRAVRRITVALRLPIGDHKACLTAVVEDGSSQPGGCALLDDAYAALRGGFLDASMDAMHDPSYHAWWEDHRASEDDLRAQARRSFDRPPLFSIVVPLFRTPIAFFDAMYDSVRGQSYGNWELILVNASPDDSSLARRISSIEDERVVVLEVENGGIAQNTNVGIEAARGDFICFLDHDDALSPDALYEYANIVDLFPDTDLLYCDEDRFDAQGRHSAPFFKPDFSPELLRAHNYITHFLCVSSKCVSCIGLMDGLFDGAQDYDFTLRAVERARRVAHVPRVLYHWRMHEASTSMNPESKTYAKDAGSRAVEAHCDRIGFKASVERTDMPFAYRVVHAPRDWGRVDIVIPTKDHAHLLRACVESILKVCTYANYRIIVVENNSEEPETFECYQNLQALDDRVSVVTWSGEFNYSKIVNFGAAQGNSPYILFLNNDTKVITPDFLETMLGYFEDEGVGVVGAKLLYADGTVQHAGVGVGLLGAAAHLFTSLPPDAGGYFDRARLPQNLSAVTGACQLVRRDVYGRVGGYTEDFTVGYNDVDFCLKTIRAGYRVVCTPYARMNHYEFSSRGRDMRGERMKRVQKETDLLRSRWSEFFEGSDPYLNPNLSKDSCYFALRKG